MSNPLDVDEVERDLVRLIENFGEGMSHADAVALFALLKARCEKFWIDRERASLH